MLKKIFMMSVLMVALAGCGGLGGAPKGESLKSIVAHCDGTKKVSGWESIKNAADAVECAVEAIAKRAKEHSIDCSSHPTAEEAVRCAVGKVKHFFSNLRF